MEQNIRKISALALLANVSKNFGSHFDIIVDEFRQ